MEYVRLGDVCTFINGDRGINYPKVEELVDEGIPFINAGHLQDNSINVSSMNYITQEKYDVLSTGKVSRGDILYCLRGSLGKHAIVEFELGAIASSLVILRPNQKKINSRYLLHVLDSKDIQVQMIKANNGSSQPNLSATSVKEFIIPLPPLHIQDRIVVVLDKSQQFIYSRKEQIQACDELIKSQFIEMFGDLQDEVSLNEYIDSLTAGKSLAGEAECGNKVLKTGSVSYDYFNENEVKNLPIDYEPLESHLIKEKDVIISRMNTAELVGATGYVWRTPKNTYLPDRLWRAELKDDMNPIFLWQLLIQESTKRKIRKIASGTSGSMKNISKQGLLGIRVINVDIEKQNQFAQFVQQVDKLKFEMKQSLIELENNFNSLMQRAFKGELF